MKQIMHISSRLLFVVLICFISVIPLDGHNLIPNHTITIVNFRNVQLYNDKVFTSEGGIKKNFKPYLIKNAVLNGKYVVLSSFDDSHYAVSKDGVKYLLEIGSDETGTVVFDYYDENEVDTFFNAYDNKQFFCEFEWAKANSIHSGNKYQIIFQGKQMTHRFILPYGLTCEEYEQLLYPFRTDEMLMNELNRRVPASAVDSLSSIYVGKEVGLATNIKNGLHLSCMNESETISVAPGISKNQLSQYSPVIVKDIRVNKSMSPNAKYYFYEMYLVPSDDNGSIMIPLCKDMSSILMTHEDYLAYVERVKSEDADVEAAAEAKRQAYVTELIKQETEKAKFERQLQDILISMYGQEDGMNTWWGKVRFGYTVEMCQTAYRHCGPYKIAYNVDTPVGETTRYTWIEDKTSLYFIDDRLVGISVIEKVRWK